MPDDLVLAHEIVEAEPPSIQSRIEKPELVAQGGFFEFVVSWRQTADGTPPWGSWTRAQYLDEFWRGDRMMSGVIYTMVSRIGSLGWVVSGPMRGLRYYHNLMMDSDSGWGDAIRLWALDYLTTDEGAVIEIGRDWYPGGAVKKLWHLDARLCIPGPISVSIAQNGGTGTYDLLFRDADGIKALKEGQFHRFCSLPSTDQRRRRLGFCFLSRALRAAKLANALTEYQEEELSDMPPEGIATVTGLTESQVRNAMAQHESVQQAKQQFTFPGILWMVGNSLGQEVKLEWHPFRRLWEKFDERASWEVFLKTLALDAGLDVAEFWQIETTGATKASVSIQHRKAQGKGPAEFLVDMERFINRDVLPWGYMFAFDQPDDDQDMLVEQVRRARIANVRELWRADPMLGEGLIDRQQALEILAEQGVIPQRYIAPPEGRLTDISKEVGEPVGILRSDGSLEGFRPYWRLEKPLMEMLRPLVAPSVIKREAKQHPSEATFQAIIEELLQQSGEDIALAYMWGQEVDWDEVSRKFFDRIEPRLRELVRDRLRADFPDLTFDQVDQVSRRWAQQHAFDLVQLDGEKSVIRSTISDLDRIKEELQAGTLDWSQLEEALTPTFGPERAARIAQTEIITAFASSGREGAAELGLGQKRSQTVRDNRVCDRCRANAEEGWLPIGGQYSSGHDGPSFHPGCRCRESYS